MPHTPLKRGGTSSGMRIPEFIDEEGSNGDVRHLVDLITGRPKETGKTKKQIKGVTKARNVLLNPKKRVHSDSVEEEEDSVLYMSRARTDTFRQDGGRGSSRTPRLELMMDTPIHTPVQTGLKGNDSREETKEQPLSSLSPDAEKAEAQVKDGENKDDEREVDRNKGEGGSDKSNGDQDLFEAASKDRGPGKWGVSRPLSANGRSLSAISSTPPLHALQQSSSIHQLRKWNQRPPNARKGSGDSAMPFSAGETDEEGNAIAEELQGLKQGRLDKVRRTLTPYLPTYGSLQTPSVVQEHHKGKVFAVAVTQNRNTIFSAGGDCIIRAHSVGTGATSHVIKGHTSVVYGLTVAHRKELLLSCSKDRTVRAWRLNFSPDKEEVQSITQEAVLSGHKSWVFDVCVLSSGELAVSASKDATIILWSLASYEQLHVFEGHNKQVFCVEPFQNDRFLSAGWDGTLRCWDAVTRSEVAKCSFSDAAMLALAVSPDYSRAVTSIVGGQVLVWRLDCFEIEAVLEGHEDTVMGVGFTLGGSTILTGSLDGTLKCWQVETMQAERTILHGGFSIQCIAFSKGADVAVAGCSDGYVRYWKVRNLEKVISLTGHTDNITAICGTPDGIRCVTACRDKVLRVWRFEEPNHVLEAEIGRHKDEILFVRVANDGATLVSASEEGTVKTWRIDTLELAKEIIPCDIDVKPMQCASLSGDGRYLFAAAKERSLVYVYDLKLGTFVENDVLDGAASILECLPSLWREHMDEHIIGEARAEAVVTDNGVVKQGNGRKLTHQVAECRIFVCGYFNGDVRFYSHSMMATPCIAAAALPEGRTSCLSVSGHGAVTCIEIATTNTSEWSKAARKEYSDDNEEYYLSVGFEDGVVSIYKCVCSVVFEQSSSKSSTQCVGIQLNVSLSPINIIQGHDKAVKGVSIHVNPEFVSLLSFGDDHTMCLWDVAAGHDEDGDGFDDIVEALCLPTDKGQVHFLREMWPCTVAAIIVPNNGQRLVKLLPFDLAKDLRGSNFSFLCAFAQAVTVDGILPLDKTFPMRNIWTSGFSVLHALFERCLDLDSRKSAIELFEAILTTDESIDAEDSTASGGMTTGSGPTGGDYGGVLEPLVLPCIGKHGTVLDWAAEVQDRDCTRLILARLSRDSKRGVLLGGQDRIVLAPALRHLFREMPDVAEEFVDAVGLEEADPIVLGSRRRVPTTLTRMSMDCPSKVPRAFWEKELKLKRKDKKETSEMPARPFVVPIPLLEPGMLNALVDGGHLPLFKSEAVQSFVSWQWRRFARRMYIIEMIMYLVVLSIVTFQIYFFSMVEKTLQAEDAVNANSFGSVGLSIFLDCLVVIYCLRWVAREAWEMVDGGIRVYLRDGWNWLEVPTLLLMLCFSILDIITSGAPGMVEGEGIVVADTRTVFGSLCGVLMWLRLLYFLRGFSGTGPFVRIVLEIVKDMKNFLLLLLIVLGGFATGMVGLFRSTQSGDFGDSGETLLTVFRLMVMDFDRAAFEDAGNLEPLALVLFCLFILIVSVVLFNLLITLMGDTYDRVAETLHAQWRYDQADLMLTLQRHRIGWIRVLIRRWRKSKGKMSRSNTISSAPHMGETQDVPTMKMNGGKSSKEIKGKDKTAGKKEKGRNNKVHIATKGDTAQRGEAKGVSDSSGSQPYKSKKAVGGGGASKVENPGVHKRGRVALSVGLSLTEQYERDIAEGIIDSRWYAPRRMRWLHIIRPARETSLSGAKKDSWLGRFHAMKLSFGQSQRETAASLKKVDLQSKMALQRAETIEETLSKIQVQLKQISAALEVRQGGAAHMQMAIFESLSGRQAETLAIGPHSSTAASRPPSPRHLQPLKPQQLDPLPLGEKGQQR